jgi:hypothetical protein
VSAAAAAARPRIFARYFSLPELSVSASHPELAARVVPAHAAAKLGELAAGVLDPLRAAFGLPVRVLSGYRSPVLNRAVGGSPTSQHVRGEAADLRPAAGTVPAVRLFTLARELARAGLLPVGQVIYYPGQDFVHVALPSRRYPAPTFCIHDPDRGRVYAVVERCAPAAGAVTH